MKRNDRIAILHYSCAPVIGGVEKIIHEHEILFRRNFYPVKIFAGSGEQCTDECKVEIDPLLGSRNYQVDHLQNNFLERKEEFDAITDKIYDYLANVLDQYDILIAHNVLTMPYNLPLTYALHRMADTACIKIVSWNHDSPYFY